MINALKAENPYHAKVEHWIDQGSGSCVLVDANIARIVEERLLYFEGQQYRLFAFGMMPNHVHDCLRPADESGLDTICRHGKASVPK